MAFAGLLNKLKNNFLDRRGNLFGLLLLIVGAVFFGFVHSTNAASLYFSPSSGTYTVGQRFSVSIGVSSSDQAMNAVSGSVSFPSDKLQVESLSKSGSVISLWVKEPSFSSGSVNFEGIVLNPGYTGKGAKILTINFRAKATGSARLSYSGPTILANDGQGTDILTGSGSASITINEAVEKPTPTPPTPTPPPVETPPAGNLPAPPKVSSTTNPDQSAWYPNSTVSFGWELPNDVIGVSYSVDSKSGTVPSTNSVGLADSFTTKNLKDGVNFFHVRFQNQAGWGPSTDFKIQTDSVPPANFEVKLLDGAETEKTKPSISWTTTDTGSGIGHYEIAIDDQNVINIGVADYSLGTAYILPELPSGKHRIAVTVVDRAGNRTVAFSSIMINTLRKPIITAYTGYLNSGEQLAISGETGYSGAEVSVWIQKDSESPQILTLQADNRGRFYFVYFIPMRKGSYKVWVQTTNDKGIQSEKSDSVSVSVGSQLPWSYILNIFLLIIIILLLIWFYWYGRKKKEKKNSFRRSFFRE